MKASPLRKHTRTGIGTPAAVDPKLRGNLAPMLMMATISLLGGGTFCTIAGALLLGLTGLPPNIAILAGQGVFAIAAVVGVTTFIYCMRNG